MYFGLSKTFFTPFEISNTQLTNPRPAPGCYYTKGQSHGVVECGGRLVADIDLGGQNRGSWQKISSSHLKRYMRDERIG